MRVLKKPIIFQWDKGNKDKNFVKHRITDKECEEVFFDTKKRIYKDELHSAKEERFIILGQTKKEKLLYTVSAVRNKKVRVISARDINRKERKLYEKKA